MTLIFRKNGLDFAAVTYAENNSTCGALTSALYWINYLKPYVSVKELQKKIFSDVPVFHQISDLEFYRENVDFWGSGMVSSNVAVSVAFAPANISRLKSYSFYTVIDLTDLKVLCNLTVKWLSVGEFLEAYDGVDEDLRLNLKNIPKVDYPINIVSFRNLPKLVKNLSEVIEQDFQPVLCRCGSYYELFY